MTKFLRGLCFFMSMPILSTVFLTPFHSEFQDFFDKFERETQGENFRHPSISGSRDNDATVKRNQHDKDDLNAFMDEFENLTSGEHFKK